MLFALALLRPILKEDAPTISDTQPPQASDPLEKPDTIEDERHNLNALSAMIYLTSSTFVPPDSLLSIITRMPKPKEYAPKTSEMQPPYVLATAVDADVTDASQEEKEFFEMITFEELNSTS